MRTRGRIANDIRGKGKVRSATVRPYGRLFLRTRASCPVASGLSGKAVKCRPTFDSLARQTLRAYAPYSVQWVHWQTTRSARP
jgi:hypothetical protein